MKRDLHGIRAQEEENYIKFIKVWSPGYDYLILRSMVCRHFKEYLPTLFNPTDGTHSYNEWIDLVKNFYKEL